MSKSIKEAIAVDTFLDVKHLGGAAAFVIADDSWFRGRRHANQAFQVYELWRNENQSPSFLSFRNTKTKSSSLSFLVHTDQDILNQIKNSVVKASKVFNHSRYNHSSCVFRVDLIN